MDESDIARAEERLLHSIHNATTLISRTLEASEDNTHCVDCGNEIPERRRKAAPFSKRCIDCQEGFEK